MCRPPRNATAPLFGSRILSLGLMQGASVLLIVLAVYLSALWGWLNMSDATALSFTTLVVANLGLIWQILGTGVAAYVASVNSPKTLVLETPYCSLRDTVCHTNPLVLPCLVRYQLPTHEYLGYVDCPVHLIHGTKDEKIDFTSSERLKNRCLELKRAVQFHPIQNGYHNLRPESDFETVLKQILE